MLTIALTANIDTIDAPTGATLDVVNVDLRQQPAAGGFFSIEAASTAIAAGSVTTPANINSVDYPTGAGNVEFNVDFRQGAVSGGFLTARVASALVMCSVATPTQPTIGTASSGSQASRTEVFAVTYIDGNGNESLPSPTASEVVGANLVATVTSPGASSGAVKYNVYGAVGAATLTLQSATPITIGTNYQEPAGGLTTTGRTVPTSTLLSAGACNVTVSQGGALASGAATVTITQ